MKIQEIVLIKKTNCSLDFLWKENCLRIRDNLSRRELSPVKRIRKVTGVKQEFVLLGFSAPYHVTLRYYLAKVDEP